MTGEKAAEIVKSAFQAWESEYRCTSEDWSEEHEACEMAVKALTKESIPVDWLKAEIKSLKTENSYTSYHLSECFKALLIDWRRGEKREQTD